MWENLGRKFTYREIHGWLLSWQSVVDEINKSMDIASAGWIENNIAKFLRGDEQIKIFEHKSLKVAVRKERGRKREEERNEALPIAKYIDLVLL